MRLCGTLIQKEQGRVCGCQTPVFSHWDTTAASQPACPCSLSRVNSVRVTEEKGAKREGRGFVTGSRPRVGRNALKRWRSGRGREKEGRLVGRPLNNKHNGFRADAQINNVTNQKTKLRLCVKRLFTAAARPCFIAF